MFTLERQETIRPVLRAGNCFNLRGFGIVVAISVGTDKTIIQIPEVHFEDELPAVDASEGSLIFRFLRPLGSCPVAVVAVTVGADYATILQVSVVRFDD